MSPARTSRRAADPAHRHFPAQQLLDAGRAPVAPRAVAERPALHAVETGRLENGVERPASHCPPARHVPRRCGGGRSAARARAGASERCRNRPCSGSNCSSRRRSSQSGTSPRGRGHGGIGRGEWRRRGDLVRAASECLGDTAQQHQHALRIDVCLAAEKMSGRRQKRGGGPTAQRVAFSDIGPPVGIDLDRHEPALDQIAYRRIAVRRARHTGARRTPRGAYRQQDGTALRAAQVNAAGPTATSSPPGRLRRRLLHAEDSNPNCLTASMRPP